MVGIKFLNACVPSDSTEQKNATLCGKKVQIIIGFKTAEKLIKGWGLKKNVQNHQ